MKYFFKWSLCFNPAGGKWLNSYLSFQIVSNTIPHFPPTSPGTFISCLLLIVRSVFDPDTLDQYHQYLWKSVSSCSLPWESRPDRRLLHVPGGTRGAKVNNISVLLSRVELWLATAHRIDETSAMAPVGKGGVKRWPQQTQLPAAWDPAQLLEINSSLLGWRWRKSLHICSDLNSVEGECIPRAETQKTHPSTWQRIEIVCIIMKMMAGSWESHLDSHAMRHVWWTHP